MNVNYSEFRKYLLGLTIIISYTYNQAEQPQLPFNILKLFQNKKYPSKK